jgi:hypothetical protein
MRTEKEIRGQMNRALQELRIIEKSQGRGWKLGGGAWTRMKGYADALEWVLGEE